MKTPGDSARATIRRRAPKNQSAQAPVFMSFVCLSTQSMRADGPPQPLSASSGRPHQRCAARSPPDRANAVARAARADRVCVRAGPPPPWESPQASHSDTVRSAARVLRASGRFRSSSSYTRLRCTCTFGRPPLQTLVALRAATSPAQRPCAQAEEWREQPASRSIVRRFPGRVQHTSLTVAPDP